MQQIYFRLFFKEKTIKGKKKEGKEWEIRREEGERERGREERLMGGGRKGKREEKRKGEK